MERHANTNNAPETIKVPLQQLSKSGKTTFAYMRRSTTKKEQASSLPQQEEGIENIALSLGIDPDSIVSYIESKSGYENRKRPEWNKMLEVIDSLKEPCTILCRDTSRLSRNPKDNLAIADRMFCDNDFRKKGQKIGKIYFLDGMKVVEWSEKTEKKYVVDTLHQNYTDSIENKNKCISGVLLKLNMGEFPYCPPHGLKRVNKDGLPRKTRNEKTTLMQDEEMPFIRHAFEMKAKGRTAKEICQYLKEYGGINISGKVLVETLFANTVYKGVYTEKTTGTLFEKIKFWEGKPPIDGDLWERASANVNKRGYGFGEGQMDHIAPGILKHESGKNLYMYKAKGKYNAYQTEIKSENGKRKSVGMMEKDIVKGFLGEVMPKIKHIYHELAWENTSETIDKLENIPEGEKENTRKRISNYYKQLYDETGNEKYNVSLKTFDDCKRYYQQIYDRGLDNFFSLGMSEINLEEMKEDINMLMDTDDETDDSIDKEFMKKELMDIFLNSQEGKTKLKEAFIQSKSLEREKQEQEIRDQQKKELGQKKQVLEEEKRNIDKKAFKLGYNADIANEMKEDTEKEIQTIQEQIDLLSESTNIEEYMNRLPQILQDLHDLSSRVLSEADYAGWRDDIKQLMEIVLHELTLTNKKELKIKLLEGLENLETSKIGNGGRNLKGYIHLSIYHKMRKRQYGNRWMTQFVPLCREEVRRLEENQKFGQVRTDGKTVQDYINDIENDLQYTNSIHEVTL